MDIPFINILFRFINQTTVRNFILFLLTKYSGLCIKKASETQTFKIENNGQVTVTIKYNRYPPFIKKNKIYLLVSSIGEDKNYKFNNCSWRQGQVRIWKEKKEWEEEVTITNDNGKKVQISLITCGDCGNTLFDYYEEVNRYYNNENNEPNNIKRWLPIETDKLPKDVFYFDDVCINLE